MQDQEKKSICVSIPKEDYERLARLAKEADRTAPGYIRWLVHKHFTDLDSGRKEL